MKICAHKAGELAASDGLGCSSDPVKIDKNLSLLGWSNESRTGYLQALKVASGSSAPDYRPHALKAVDSLFMKAAHDYLDSLGPTVRSYLRAGIVTEKSFWNRLEKQLFEAPKK